MQNNSKIIIRVKIYDLLGGSYAPGIRNKIKRKNFRT